jgi:hypothetical protein
VIATGTDRNVAELVEVAVELALPDNAAVWTLGQALKRLAERVGQLEQELREAVER